MRHQPSPAATFARANNCHKTMHAWQTLTSLHGTARYRVFRPHSVSMPAMKAKWVNAMIVVAVVVALAVGIIVVVVMEDKKKKDDKKKEEEEAKRILNKAEKALNGATPSSAATPVSPSKPAVVDQAAHIEDVIQVSRKFPQSPADEGNTNGTRGEDQSLDDLAFNAHVQAMESENPMIMDTGGKLVPDVHFKQRTEGRRHPMESLRQEFLETTIHRPARYYTPTIVQHTVGGITGVDDLGAYVDARLEFANSNNGPVSEASQAELGFIANQPEFQTSNPGGHTRAPALAK